MSGKILKLTWFVLVLGLVLSQQVFAAVTTAPTVGTITVSNNLAGALDTVVVTSVISGDVVKVYSSATALVPIGITTSTGTTATVFINQLGVTAGSVYVTLQSGTDTESTRTPVTYTAESVYGLINTSNITVTNNITGTFDSITVSGLVVGDIVRAYSTLTSTTPIAAALVLSGTSATMYVQQLGATASNVYITGASATKIEGAKQTKPYGAEVVTPSLTADRITVTNNAIGTDDTVVVTGLQSTDVVNVYGVATGGTAFTSTSSFSSGTTTVTIPQLTASAGNVYVSVTTPGKNESLRILKAYTSETSVAPAATTITVNNNYLGTDDTVVVTGLAPDDVVTVYDAATSGTTLGTKTVASGANSATVTITYNSGQLGIGKGNVYVSVTKVNKLESTRTLKAYISEPAVKAPLVTAITVTNNYVGTDDTIAVTGLLAADVVKVYTVATGGTALTSTSAFSSGTITVSVPQLGSTAGTIYVSVTSTNGLESARTPVTYKVEDTTAAPLGTAITVTNNATEASDTVVVTGLTATDVVKVYAASSGGTALTSTSAFSSGTITVTIPQIGVKAGNVYVSVKSTDKLESARTAKAYIAEPVTPALTADKVTITNNKAGTNDTIVITGINASDVVKVYSTATDTTVLGTATGGANAIISTTQLGVTAGNAYISIKATGKNESVRLSKAYASETSIALPAAAITVTNNYVGTPDTVLVTGLVANDVITVYDAATSGTTLGTATVASNATSATATITSNSGQLGVEKGNVYVSVTRVNKLESATTLKAYAAETPVAAPNADNITVTNNYAPSSDTVVVTGLKQNDKIKVYTVATGGTATEGIAGSDGTATVTIAQLGITAGTVYVSLISTNGLESARTPKTYKVEPTTDAPSADTITVTNNESAASDKVDITGLLANDVVTIYPDATTTTPTISGTVPSDGNTISLTITQLGVKAGSIYVTVKSTGKLVSTRTAKTYITEPVSPILTADQITVVNNKAGTDDTVTVAGLVVGDIVKIYKYSDAMGGTALNSEVVTSGASVIVSYPQLSITAGTVYVSVKKANMNESKRVAKTYITELSAAPVAANISIVNNLTGTDDTITVTGLKANDIVTVYDAAVAGNTLGTATVTDAATSAIVTTTNVGGPAGSVYITITSTGKAESIRVKKAFSAEAAINTPVAGNITVTNNTGSSDTIDITNVANGEIIKAYSSATGATQIGTVTSNGTSATITLSLGATAGTVYVTITGSNNVESARVSKAFGAELVATVAPLAGTITVTNKISPLKDIVDLTDLAVGDVVKVYDAATDGNEIGTATVTSGTTVSIIIDEVGATTGDIYVTVKSLGKSESTRTAKTFADAS